MASYDVISADSHVFEPPSLWAEYIDPAYRDRAPHSIQQDGSELFIVDGLEPAHLGYQAAAGTKPEEISVRGRHEDGIRGGWDPEARLEDMKLDGVDAEVIYTTLGFRMFRIEDPGYQAACFAAYNDWLADMCGTHPERLLSVGLISMRNIDAAKQELRRIANKGMSAAAITANPGEDRPYSDPAYDSFWAEAQELGLPISLHIFTEHARHKGQAPPGDFVAVYAVSPVLVQTSLATLITAGVMERYPGLKFVSVENDIGWAGTFLARLDHAFDRHRHWANAATTLTMKPSDYFHRQVSCTFQDDQVGVDLRYYIGLDNIMWSSDYPHIDSTWPESQKYIDKQFGTLPQEERWKIVCGNAARLYGLV